MATPTTEPLDAPPFPSEVTLALSSPIELLDEDGENLETEWHRWAMNILIESVRQHYRDRNDLYAGGNMFVYYNERQARNRDYRGPDVFFVWGRPPEPKRRWWAVWEEEGHLPNVIIELMSPSTRHIDLGAKKVLYQNTFRTDDYFCYDPFTHEFLGWSLTAEGYEELVPNERGWLWSEQLQLWLGAVSSVVSGSKDIYLRFMTPDGKLVETFEGAARAEGKRVQRQAKRAVQLAQDRADAAEAKLATLKAQLKAKDNPSR